MGNGVDLENWESRSEVSSQISKPPDFGNLVEHFSRIFNNSRLNITIADNFDHVFLLHMNILLYRKKYWDGYHVISASKRGLRVESQFTKISPYKGPPTN